MNDSEAIKRLWSSGDYSIVGDRFAAVGADLVAEVGVAGLDVLDVATGTGNTAIPAALAGGRVTGLDITPALLDIARARATEQGAAVRWVEADMRDLGFPEASFDRVLSTFGVFVVPEQREMAEALVRVCRPGGLIGVTAWSPDGAFARFSELLESHMPEDRRTVLDPDPRDWARPDKVRALFAGLPVEVDTSLRAVRITWPSPEVALEMMTTRCGPMMGRRATLTEVGAWEAAAADATRLFGEMNADDGGFGFDAAYLRTIVRR